MQQRYQNSLFDPTKGSIETFGFYFNTIATPKSSYFKITFI